MLIAAFYIAFFLFLTWRMPFFRLEKIHRAALPAVFLLKLAAGFFLTWIYTSYYKDRSTADIYKYYDDAKVIYSAFENHHYSDYFKMISGLGNDNPYFDVQYYNKMNNWYRIYDFSAYNDNHTIIRVNALIMPFAFGSFHVHTVFMCFASLFGLTALYRCFAPHFAEKEKILFGIIFLVPSVLFWGSGVLKEGILLLALGFLFYSFWQLFVRRQHILLNILSFCLSVFLLLINKNYLLLAVAPALLCYFIVHRFALKRPLLFYGGFYLTALVLSLLFSHNLLENLSLKQRDFIAVSQGGVYLQNGRQFARIAPDKKEYLDTLSKSMFRIKPGSKYMYWNNTDLTDTIFVASSTDTSTYALVWDLPHAGSTISIAKVEPNLFSFIKTAPLALYNSLCKPGLFSAGSFLELVSALENTVVLIFLLGCLLRHKKTFDKNIFALCLFISLSILLLIGYTTPVAGAIMRYKVPVMSFLLMCGLVVLDETKIRFLSKK
jgi:hypothetical protein